MKQRLARWKKLIGRMVCITWADSAGLASWRDKSEEPITCVECTSVGQLRSVGAMEVNLHSSWHDDQVMHQLAIPSDAVIEITELVRV